MAKMSGLGRAVATAVAGATATVCQPAAKYLFSAADDSAVMAIMVDLQKIE